MIYCSCITSENKTYIYCKVEDLNWKTIIIITELDDLLNTVINVVGRQSMNRAAGALIMIPVQEQFKNRMFI